VKRGRTRWNHNIQYEREVLDLVPQGTPEALDVGCGEGWLARELSTRVGHVTGIDPDENCIVAARSQDPGSRSVEYVLGDFLTYPFEPGSFDMITCVPSLHHIDEESGLRRMAALLRPGGRLAVVGLARSRIPMDLPWDAAGAVTTQAHLPFNDYWDTPAQKIWPPPRTYPEVRSLAGSILPQRRFRRRILWRYSITWTKPSDAGC
jgi:ubiquinone/menaquinone biosynthesis C-methylase UbiE